MSHTLDTSATPGPLVSLLGPADHGRWDAFVRNHPRGTACHGAAWRQAMEHAFPNVSGHFLALEEPGTRRILAGLPIYSIKSWLRGNRLVCVPFAAWCDPLASNDQELELLLQTAKKMGAKISSKFTEVRVRHTTELVKARALIPSRRWLHHFVVLDRSREDLWRSLSRTSVRQLIRSAEKSGTEIRREEGTEAMAVFHHLLSGKRRRLGLPPIPLRFFHALQQHLKADGHVLLLARTGGVLHGGILATKNRTTFHLEYAGATSALIPKGTMQLLYWNAMMLAQDEGCREFSFGRTNSHHAGLAAHKRHWGCVEEPLWEYRTHAKPISDTVMTDGFPARLAKLLFRTMPQPFCHLAGEFIYRHR